MRSIPDLKMVPPFFGSRVIDISTDELFKVLSRKVLFEGRWGFSKGRLSDEEYNRIIETKAKPALENLIKQESENPRIECKAVYGFYKCYSEDDSIVVDNDGKLVKFGFPRKAPLASSLNLNNDVQSKQYQASCLSDFVTEEHNCIALFAVTIGSKIIEAEKKLFEANSYYDYHLLHGLGAEMADCGAVVTHRIICENLLGKKLRLSENKFGCRYSFGYPACPELSYQKLLFDILEPTQIGVALTESCQMVPELSVSGFILFNPEARYIVP